MSLAKLGDMVKTHYTGKMTDGTVFDSSEGNDPLAGETLVFDIQLVDIV